MDKKAFTLVEVLLVIVIMAIITLMVLPDIRDMLATSKNKKYIAIENLLKTNLELYNLDHMEDLWCTPTETITCPETIRKTFSLTQLLEVNPDIKLDNCTINTMQIEKSYGKFTYTTQICCRENGELIYKTDEYTNCP